MREKLTAAFVKNAPLPKKGDRIIYWDSAKSGFGLMVTESDARSFVFQYRNKLGQSRRISWRARVGDDIKGLTLDQARKEATKVAGDVERGLDPVVQKRAACHRKKAETGTTLKAICELWLERKGGMTRHADGTVTFSGKMRSTKVCMQIFERLIYPEKIAGKQIGDIKRSALNELLDKIEECKGARMAHVTLAHLSSVFNWHAVRNDDFRSPIVRGMGKVNAKERARSRVLSDDEIRDLWAALDDADVVPARWAAYVRMLLLTALRRSEAAQGAWAEIEHIRRDDYEGEVLTVPAARMKNKKDHAIPLTPQVLTLLQGRPDARECQYVFGSSWQDKPINGFGHIKTAVDKAVAARRTAEGRPPVPRWTFHDLRRTAKTLMQRAGVRPDISERVLSHTITGVEGIYDRYGYLPEKLDALTRLAALIDRIVHPPADNVTSLDEHRAKSAAS